LGQITPGPPAERKILLSAGAAAGMAATFGAPLAAVVLAIELLLFEFSPRAFIPLAVATSLAGGVHALLFNSGPLFTVPAHKFSGLGQLPLFVGLGLVCGLLAFVISRGLFAVEAGFRKLPGSHVWHPIIGAVVWASLGLLVPRALGVGYDVIDDALAGRLAMATLASLVIAKLVIWWIALASGTSGGTLAPILLISSCFGALAGELLSRAFPGLGISPTAFALVAMAATFGAAARAPFAAMVFVFELTRDYNAILPLMMATVLADLVARSLLPHSIMTEKLARRGLVVPSGYHADPLATTLVRAVMSAPVITVDADADVATAADIVAKSGHSALPVVEGAEVVAMVSRDDLAASEDAGQSVREVAIAPVVTVQPDDSLHQAFDVLSDAGVDHLPVLDDGRLVGICTRADILQARLHQISLEQTERGWLNRRRNGKVEHQLT